MNPGASVSLGSPFSIGGVEIPNRVVLAPMAGLTSSAYRRHLKGHGVGLVTTEMVSAYGLVHRNVRTSRYLDFAEEERPIAVQLFGDTPEVMARAAELVLSRPGAPDILDLNMGCPVRKVVRTGAGAAFLADPDRAVRVAAAVVGVARQAGIPVTVKLRSGTKEGDRTAVALASRLEAVGVQGIAVHPRAASQHYHGAADHGITAAVVGAVAVPVLASGDVTSARATIALLEATGAAAVMVARGVVGNPWLVGELLAGEGQERPTSEAAGRPPLETVITDLRALLSLAAAERGSEGAGRWLRGLLGKYLRPSGVSVDVIGKLRALPDAVMLDAALAELLPGTEC